MMRTHDSDRERGATAVEFALVLPILVLLVFGIAAFGVAYSDYIRVTAAAREGARAAAVGADAGAAVARCGDGLSLESVSYTADGSGDYVRVVVGAPVSLDLHSPLFTAREFTVRGSASMRMEGAP